MTRGLKTALIVALILFGIGIALIAVGFAVSGFNFENFSTRPDRTEKTYDTNVESIKAFILDDSNNSIEFIESTDNKIYITYFESEKEYYNIEKSDSGTLSMEFISELKWFEYFVFNFSFESTTITVSLPSEFKGSINAKTSNGGITMTELAVSDDVRLRSSNGTVEATGVDITGDLDVHSSNGKLILTDITADNIIGDTSNGKVDAKNLTAAEDIELETNNGSIYITKINADEQIILKTSNGSIKGSIIGDRRDFEITSHTSNGHNNLPEDQSGGDIYLDVRTSNGSIDIDFVD
ncbi:MAG: hypothetical protein A2Y17_08445 [Clostridiales bacterium GWF2_38_85]|nr:MAG: hypothetical protein A2Y17_08445 [Clostridiales bacterium GWF2_38_85]HBL83778.1 hypothetical protein [Clostridiales bacterium]